MSAAEVILNRDPLLEISAARLIRFNSEAEWLGFKSGPVVGASQSPVLFGQGYSGSSAYKMYAESLGLIEREPMSDKRLRVGKLMEPVLRRLFTEETGYANYEVGDNSIHQSIQWPFLVASLDGVCVTEDGVGVLELKNISSFNRDEWTEDSGPLRYQIQVQHQLAVTGLPFGYLFGLIGGQEPFVHRINRNEDFIHKALLPTVQRFIECVENRVPPEIDGSEATAKAIKLLHPDDNGSEVVLDDRFVDFDARLEELKEQEKAISGEKKILENEIKAAIGDATFALLPNGVRYSFKTTAREGYFVEPSKYRTLRRSKAR